MIEIEQQDATQLAEVLDQALDSTWFGEDDIMTAHVRRLRDLLVTKLREDTEGEEG